MDNNAIPLRDYRRQFLVFTKKTVCFLVGMALAEIIPRGTYAPSVRQQSRRAELPPAHAVSAPQRKEYPNEPVPPLPLATLLRRNAMVGEQGLCSGRMLPGAHGRPRGRGRRATHGIAPHHTRHHRNRRASSPAGGVPVPGLAATAGRAYRRGPRVSASARRGATRTFRVSLESVLPADRGHGLGGVPQRPGQNEGGRVHRRTVRRHRPLLSGGGRGPGAGLSGPDPQPGQRREDLPDAWPAVGGHGRVRGRGPVRGPALAAGGQ